MVVGRYDEFQPLHTPWRLWVFRHRVDTACPQLPNTPQHKLAADAALDSMMGLLGQKGNNFTEFQAAVLRHNWRHAWCENPPTAPIYPKLYADTAMINSLPVGELTHDFKLYLGSRVDELPENSGSTNLYDGELFLQQYLSSLYWSLTMLMKTAYVGPDTYAEKALSCLLVMLGAIVFAMIMGAVVSIIKAVEAHNASLRGLLGQAALYAKSRRVPIGLSKSLQRFVETQWLKTAGLDNGEVLGRVMRLPTRFHDEILLTVYEELIPSCPLLSAAQAVPGAGALPPLLRLLNLQVVLQKSLLIGDNSTCKEIYILVKGSLQAELSSKAKSEIEAITEERERKKNEHHHRGGLVGGGGLPGLGGGLPGLGGLDQEALAAELLKEQESNRGGPKPKGGGKSKMMSACAEEESTTPAAIKQLRAEAAAAEAGEEKSQLPTKRSKKMEDMGAAGAGNNLSMMGAAKCGNQMSKCAKGVKKGGKKGKQFMSRHIMERDGSMIGFSDPLQKPGMSPFVVTALKNTEVLAVGLGPLKAIVNLLPSEDAHAICSVVQAQHNKLMEALKAKDLCGDSVDRRKEQHEQVHTQLRMHPPPSPHSLSTHPSSSTLPHYRCSRTRGAIPRASRTRAIYLSSRSGSTSSRWASTTRATRRPTFARRAKA